MCNVHTRTILFSFLDLIPIRLRGLIYTGQISIESGLQRQTVHRNKTTDKREKIKGQIKKYDIKQHKQEKHTEIQTDRKYIGNLQCTIRIHKKRRRHTISKL